jgi:hypothetical protein
MQHPSTDLREVNNFNNCLVTLDIFWLVKYKYLENGRILGSNEQQIHEKVQTRLD